MGCCVSTSKHSSSSSSPPHHSRSAYSHPKLNRIANRAPPPLEEESVKEVLSETPKPKPLLSNHDGSASRKVNGRIPIHPTEEISEVSDVCSFSETLSTTTVTEKLDDFEEIRQRICRSPAKLPKNRSPSDDWAPKRDRMVGKSPTRKSDQSPSRINGSGGTVKLVQSRDMGQGLTRRSPRSEPRLQNRTENAYRRSRSPAYTRTDGVGSRTAAGRSSSVRRSGMSPGREPTAGREYYRTEPGQSQATQNSTIEGKWRTTNESLDNPLVSLECFIFL